MTPRFHVPGPLASGDVVELPEKAGHHAVRVLRLRIDDEVTMFDGRGGEYTGRITSIGRKSVQTKLGEHNPVERESPLIITLLQGVSSGDRMDTTVQKSVELGVQRIVPLAAERSVVRLSDDRAERRLSHWQQIAIGACEQCGRNRIPVVESVTTLDTFPDLGQLPETRWMLAPGSGTGTLREMPRPGHSVVLLVGPEGGFSPREYEIAVNKGFRTIQLGPRILRTETAAVAALSTMQAMWGDF